MRQKISKLAKELNVSVSTAVEFLRKNGVEVEDNLNARIDESAVALLHKEFRKDASVKATVDMQRSEKRAAAAKDRAAEIAAAKAEEEARKAEAKRLEAERKARAEAEEAQRKAAIEKARAEEAARKAAEAKAEAERKAAQEAKAKAEAEAKAARENELKAAQAGKHPEMKDNSDKQSANNDAPRTASPADISAAATAAELQKEGPQLKILGKIDLSALNQNTRPKKKSKEERRRERIDKSRAQNGQNATQGGDKRKRTRIGKEKVDVEKAGQQVANERRNHGKGGNNGNNGQNNNSQNGNGRNNNRGGNNRNDRRNQGNRNGGAHNNEVRSEDVQKQVKETLARLTNKSTKKSVKWRKEKREEAHNRELANQQREAAESKIIKITEFVTANDLANLMEIPVNSIIATCMNLGVMVSINQRLDAETINIVAEEFGYTTEYVSAEVSEAIASEEDKEEDLVPRPPIVTVMGHVDHGKTSLLDFIRNANVIAGEAGGITQHIGAYNVKLADGRHITFLDTPGHEAFTAMRARGAKVTDLAIIIVAADDNVMPQTIEAINHASAAGVPMVFAINKIDKPAANPDNIKQELANMNYLVEEWGGKYQSQDISAKKGIGVDELMEKVLLEAEMLDLKANPNRMAVGSVIESSLDKGRGYVATVLVQNGTLRVGDVVLAGTHYGKVKAMFNERNQRIKEAGPAVPVLILGLNGAPQAGDTFNVLETEQEAREIAGKREQLQRELSLRTKKRPGLEELGRRRALNDFHELNLVVKGDVDGSIEALSDSLIKLSTPEIQVNVLHKGVGAISESDVTLAAASDAIIIGFQVRPSAAARREADKEGVEIRLYSVIYKAIEEVKDAMEGLLSPEIKEEITGNAEVLQTYHISKVGTIAGAIVRDGKIKRQSKVRVVRDGIVIYTGELGSLKRFKDDVKEVVSGYDCGLSVQGYNDIREGDIIEAFEEVEVKKTL
ncbi:MAG: translation initiation factor IF-2 [Bacteroides sp.]|nr:translation initiation factor IF-2 [Bacteroides sp.]MDE6234355.1 translation initiation factor IF-2 [Muribaculaceae bacterium]